MLRGGIVKEFGIDMYTMPYLKWITRDLPGGPVVKTLPLHCKGRGFDP